MDMPLVEMGKAFIAISALIGFILLAIWMMYLRPRVQDMLNAMDKRMVEGLDNKYGYTKGQPFAEREKTNMQINDLEHKQVSDSTRFVNIEKRIDKLEK